MSSAEIVGLDDPTYVAAQYATECGLAARKSVYAAVTGLDAGEIAFQAIAGRQPGVVLEVGCGEGELAERINSIPASSSSRSISRLAWWSWPGREHSTRASQTSSRSRSQTARSISSSRPGCSATSPISSAASRRSRGFSGPAGRSSS